MIKTVTLETAKKLKEAGFSQETTFYWCEDLGEITYSKNCNGYGKANCGSHPAAPIAEEVLDELPFQKDAAWAVIGKNPLKEEWVIDFKDKLFKGESLAEASAKMYLYLVEKGLLGK